MRGLGFVLLCFLFASCAVSKPNSSIKKFSPSTLVKDYDLFRDMLEETHPGLYWYTPKDSMDYYFDRGREMLQDSLTETKFRAVLSYVVAKIRCGHTAIRPSRHFSRFGDSLRNRQFPLSLKIWKDTAVVTYNLNRKDSAISRGAIITHIDGQAVDVIARELFEYLPADGYNETHKYQTLSNRGAFGSLYMTMYGYKPFYTIDFIDTTGRLRKSRVAVYAPVRDSASKANERAEARKISRRERNKIITSNARSLRIDTAISTGFLEVNTFTKVGRLRSFFRSSFKQLEKQNVDHLVIDLRGNGGGNVLNSNLLTKFIADKPFRIADSLYAQTRGSRYGQYQQHRIWNWLFMMFMTRKKNDGLYHFGYFEKKYFKPRNKNHFDGQVYVLSGGNTFSASTLFIKSVKEQPNVTIVGEETGGGAYGNNAWLIPDVTLPHTKVRFRLPLFRLVIDKNEVKGIGVQPEVKVLPTVSAIQRNEDFKTDKAVELIKTSTPRLQAAHQ